MITKILLHQHKFEVIVPAFEGPLVHSDYRLFQFAFINYLVFFFFVFDEFRTVILADYLLLLQKK